MAKLQCVVVTPEKTEIDREVDALVLPMYDGEMGVLANRAPVIGRLGYGTLTMTVGSSKERFFIDGGFVQIENNVVSVLTARVTPVSQLDVAEAQRALEASLEMPGDSEEQRQLRDAAILRARGQIRSAR
ncbi:MAG: F0F1 ATP synthase subunit epsilon [Pirellulaceae bacterium]